MRAAPLALAFGCLLAVAATAAGCGGDSGSDGSATKPAEDAESRPAPPKSEFPKARGRSLESLLELADSASELVVSPAAKVFYRGENRYPFGIFERDGAEVTDAEAALYFARVPTPPKRRGPDSGGKGPVAEAQARALKEPAVGPFPAAIESLLAAPAFRSPPSPGLEPATAVYTSELDFPSEGEWRIAALIKEGDRLTTKVLPGTVVGEFRRVPRPGQKAPNLPSGAQNRAKYARALGKRPIVLLFATPQFCQSRVCGPVVDVAEQAKRDFGDEAAFIHMQIYNDNDPGKGVRPEVRAFHLPSQPWLFTVDRGGVIEEAIEGAFGPELMTEAVERVVAE